MSDIGKIIRVNALPPVGERENNVIYQVAAPGAATYTDYAIDANGDLKTHAVVEGSIPVELSDDHVSISNLELIEEGLTTQAEFNSATTEKLHQKLNKPTDDGNVNDYPKILGVHDNGNVAKLPAGDLGKNIANSSLTSVAGAGLTLGANWTLNTSGLYYSITGLSDVSNDSSFNTFLTQNAAGRVEKSNGKGAFISLPSLLSDSEKNTWKTAMNGGWTTNTMSVALISPSIVSKEDKPQWLALKGANLNFNPASFSITLVHELGTEYVVNNSQVQLYTNGLDLAFWYNFKSLPLGTYKIKLWNGVSTYTTGSLVTILLVSNVAKIDLTALSWEKKSFTQAQVDNVITASSSAVHSNNIVANKAYSNPPEIICSAKSSKIVDADVNFYIKGAITASGPRYNSAGAILGVATDQPLSLVNSCQAFVKAQQSNSLQTSQKNAFADIGASIIEGISTPDLQSITFSFVIMRNQGVYTIIISGATQSTVFTKIGSTDALHLNYYGFNVTDSANQYGEVNITEAYTF